MTNEEILAGNKSIAEFMGLDKCTHTEKINNPQHPRYKHPLIYHGYCMEENSPIVSNMYTDIPGYCWNYDKEDNDGNTINRLVFFISELKYNSSWDWLMPVVIKIESLGFDVKIKGIACSINRLCEDETIIQFVLGDRARKIELVWSVVLDFIKWYNEQPK